MKWFIEQATKLLESHHKPDISENFDVSAFKIKLNKIVDYCDANYNRSNITETTLAYLCAFLQLAFEIDDTLYTTPELEAIFTVCLILALKIDSDFSVHNIDFIKLTAPTVVLTDQYLLNKTEELLFFAIASEKVYHHAKLYLNEYNQSNGGRTFTGVPITTNRSVSSDRPFSISPSDSDRSIDDYFDHTTLFSSGTANLQFQEISIIVDKIEDGFKTKDSFNRKTLSQLLILANYLNRTYPEANADEMHLVAAKFKIDPERTRTMLLPSVLDILSTTCNNYNYSEEENYREDIHMIVADNSLTTLGAIKKAISFLSALYPKIIQTEQVIQSIDLEKFKHTIDEVARFNIQVNEMIAPLFEVANILNPADADITPSSTEMLLKLKVTDLAHALQEEALTALSEGQSFTHVQNTINYAVHHTAETLAVITDDTKPAQDKKSAVADYQSQMKTLPLSKKVLVGAAIVAGVMIGLVAGAVVGAAIGGAVTSPLGGIGAVLGAVPGALIGAVKGAITGAAVASFIVVGTATVGAVAGGTSAGFTARFFARKNKAKSSTAKVDEVAKTAKDYINDHNLDFKK